MALVSLSLRPEGAASPKPIANAFAPPPNPNIRSLIQTAEPRVGDLERVGVSLFSAPGSMFLGVGRCDLDRLHQRYPRAQSSRRCYPKTLPQTQGRNDVETSSRCFPRKVLPTSKRTSWVWRGAPCGAQHRTIAPCQCGGALQIPATGAGRTKRTRSTRRYGGCIRKTSKRRMEIGRLWLVTWSTKLLAVWQFHLPCSVKVFTFTSG